MLTYMYICSRATKAMARKTPAIEEQIFNYWTRVVTCIAQSQNQNQTQRLRVRLV